VLHADSVDVNENEGNDQAIGFYRHLGFRQIGRSPVDPAGNPFPILHLALQAELQTSGKMSSRHDFVLPTRFVMLAGMEGAK
jgi:ribosomal protein S18 acetylase RimI-like enzyme